MTEEKYENLRLSGVPAEIRTKHFEDTSLKLVSKPIRTLYEFEIWGSKKGGYEKDNVI
jgi:hypothetical protein